MYCGHMAVVTERNWWHFSKTDYRESLQSTFVMCVHQTDHTV